MAGNHPGRFAARKRTLVAVGAAAAVAIGGAVAVAAFAQTSFPATAGQPGTPLARADASVGYDPDTRQVVLFGGQGSADQLGDTWVWDGSVWRPEITAQSPPSRVDAPMVFDPKLHALVLFGGVPGSPAGDDGATWLWTGRAWERRATAHNPASVQGELFDDHLAYDAATGLVVLIAAPGALEFEACSDDTWTFDGNDWHQEHPATPLPASAATLVNESQTGHVVAVVTARDAVDNPRGGQSCAVGSNEARALPGSSTWRWTGSNWVQVAAGTEPGGADVGDTPVAYFSGLLTVSGTSMIATQNTESLWSWTGSRWIDVPGSATGSPLTSQSALSLDGRGRVVLFGGATQPNGPDHQDTWTWDGTQWSYRSVAYPTR
jgi:hypothetical protein